MRFGKVAIWLLVAAAGCVAALMVLGAYPIPRNGRGIGHALGGAVGLFLPAIAGAGIAYAITRKSYGSNAPLATGLSVLLVFTALNFIGGR